MSESWSAVESDPQALYKWGLLNQEADVRLQAVWLIGQRKDFSALTSIVKFLKDKDQAVRGMAAWAIIHTAGRGYVGGVES